MDDVKKIKEIDKFYTCKYDRAFKEVMLQENDTEILQCLLESILKLKINKIEIKNQERNSRNIHVKRKHLDAILLTDVGVIEIEINTYYNEYVRVRNMAYISDIYASDTVVGDNYSEDKRFIQINLTYGLKDKKDIRIYKVRDDEKKEYVSNLYIYEINMDYYKKIWYDNDEKKINENKYLIMLDLNPEELKRLSSNDKVVRKYMDKVTVMNTDYQFKEYMSAEEDARKIHNTLMKRAEDAGINKTKKSIAIKMLKNNIDKNTIAACTGLTIEQINRLK